MYLGSRARSSHHNRRHVHGRIPKSRRSRSARVRAHRGACPRRLASQLGIQDRRASHHGYHEAGSGGDQIIPLQSDDSPLRSVLFIAACSYSLFARSSPSRWQGECRISQGFEVGATYPIRRIEGRRTNPKNRQGGMTHMLGQLSDLTAAVAPGGRPSRASSLGTHHAVLPIARSKRMRLRRIRSTFAEEPTAALGNGRSER